MKHLFVGCAVALTWVYSLSVVQADAPPPATNSAPTQGAANAPQATPGASLPPTSSGTGPVVLKPGVWTNLTPVDSKMQDSKRRTFCQGFAIDPKNPATIYLCVENYELAEGKGLYKTTDSGATWRRIGQLDDPIHVSIDPKDSNHLYCVDGVRGTTQSFWVSSDGGETWKKPAGLDVDTQTPIDIYDTYSVAADPTDFNHILVSFHFTLYRGPWKGKHVAGIVESLDGGEHWKTHEVPTKTDTSTSGCSIFFLYDPANKIGDAKTWLFTTQFPEWYRTEDGGVTWTQVYDQKMTHGGQQLYRTSNNVLYAGGIPAPARSTDNGKTWTTLTTSTAKDGNGGFFPSPYMGICGDGTNIYCAGRFSGGYYTSPETDGLTWKKYLPDQKFLMEPFEMHYDAKNGIMYSAPWQDGFWALKLEEK